MPVITRDEYLEINDVPLATPAWEVLDLSPLWDVAGFRGDDRLIPQRDGEKPLRRRIAAMRVQVPLIVYGDADQDGMPYSEGRAGLRANLVYLEEAFMVPNLSNADGTWPLVLHLPAGETLSGDCIVNPPLQLAPKSPTTVLCVLDIKIPAGVLTEGS